jgi:hypothetical protein
MLEVTDGCEIILGTSAHQNSLRLETTGLIQSKVSAAGAFRLVIRGSRHSLAYGNDSMTLPDREARIVR